MLFSALWFVLSLGIRPPLAERANAVTARSISPASRMSTGLTYTPTDGAMDWIMENWPIPLGIAGSRRTPLASHAPRTILVLAQKCIWARNWVENDRC